MEKVIMGTRLPAKLWLDEVEDSCMSQIMDLTSLPFAFKHIAIMPDAHAGKGMPIGGVLATNGVIVPNAVGVDIGCGMCAIKTNLKAEDFSYTDLTSIMSKIRAVVLWDSIIRIKSRIRNCFRKDSTLKRCLF